MTIATTTITNTMAHQSNRTRSSFQSISYLIVCIIFSQLLSQTLAQSKQHDSVIASNQYMRSSSTVSTNPNDIVSEGEEEIYDDEEASEDFSSTMSTTRSASRFTTNKTSAFPAQSEEVAKIDYDDELDADQNDEHLDDGNTHPDDANVFNDPNNINRPVLDPTSNTGKKPADASSTSRLPFVSSNLWRDLFTKPGILVGIIGGVVIGMLSAILLVMFIIYRMRKKDEGSYALEEGPRKSPSHAYTRVSSREFFA